MTLTSRVLHSHHESASPNSSKGIKMTEINERLLAEVRRRGLSKGAHLTSDGDMCLLEMVAFVQGLPHTDHPACVSAVLSAFGRELNDGLPDGLRQELIPTIPLLPGTADDGLDEARCYLASDWFIRTWLLTWLDLIPSCRVDAVNVRGLSPITDRASAAWDAARDAAWDAAWDAARDAAGDAARDAAWDAALDAARDAARDAAWDAAWDAARAALAPIVDKLRTSAIELFIAMINPRTERR